MTTTSRFNLLVAFAAALLSSSCARENKPEILTEAIPHADNVLLYEGLPHQTSEPALLEKERRTKPVQELNGYPFYHKPLELTGKDAERLSEIMADPATFGCQEVKLFGPGLESRNDLSNPSFKKLLRLLPSYRKNRPVTKDKRH
jgi:hypothetical protein